jgi:hypothetical protein
MEFLKRQRKGWSSKEQGGSGATPMDPILIQELDKEEGVDQQSVEGEVATLKDAKEKEVPKVGVQPLKKVQPSRMEINMAALAAKDARRKITMLDKVTLLERGIHISDLNRFMWIHMK